MRLTLALGTFLALSATRPGGASGQRQSSEFASTANAGDAASPDWRITERLSQQLACMCGDCEAMSLAECECEFARREREQLRAEVSSLDLASRDAQRRAYDRVLQRYTSRFPGREVLVNAQHAVADARPWFFAAGTLAIGAVGLGVMIWLAEALRRRSSTVPGRRKGPTSSRHRSRIPKR